MWQMSLRVEILSFFSTLTRLSLEKWKIFDLVIDLMIKVTNKIVLTHEQLKIELLLLNMSEVIRGLLRL